MRQAIKCGDTAIKCGDRAITYVVTAIPVVLLTALDVVITPGIANAASPLAAADNDQLTIGFIQAVLIGLGYYLSQSPWFFGLSFFTFYRPLVAGLFVGLILGEPAQGTLIGAAINLIYLGFISAGGSIPGDPALAGWVGTTLAIAGNLSFGAALALAVPIGLLGTVIWNTRMTVDAGFVHMADRAAERADIRGVARCNWLWPQIFLFAITFIPVTVAVFLGTTFVTDVINSFPAWVLSGLAIAGGILPAIGIAMNMRFIFRGSAIPYFFLGYVAMVAAAGKVSITILGVIGVVLAILHVYFAGDRLAGAARGARDSSDSTTTGA
jgi:mannose/fructose/N-acetylgalactosamine-specific phosphotransferase system component IIC